MVGAGRQDSGGLIVTDSSIIMQHNHGNRDVRNSVGVFIYTLSETTKVLRPIALDSSTLRQLVGGTFYAFIASCLV